MFQEVIFEFTFQEKLQEEFLYSSKTIKIINPNKNDSI